MSKLMTTSYQILSTKSTDYGEIRLYGRYISQSQENNTTTYQVKSTYYLPNNNITFDNGWNFLGDPNSDRKSEVNYGSTTFYRGETTIQERSWTISHNQDGSTPTQYVETNWWASFGGGGLCAENITFPDIQRYAIITNAPDFNDEENPTLTFTNTGQYNVRPMLYAIYNDERVIISAGESLQSGETSYTFDLDEDAYMDSSHISQRNKLRQLCTGQSIIIIFAVQTSSSPPYVSTARATMSIVNATPTITSSATETNQKVIAFLGSSSASTIIANASELHFAPTITTLKYATISALTITNNGVPYTQTTSPFEKNIPIYNDNSFILNVVDSRGLTASVVDNQRTLLSYNALKINNCLFKREAPTSNNVIINLECVYYSTVGNTSNPVVVKWKLENGSYNTIPSSNYVIDTTNHTLKIVNYELTNILNYKTPGQFTIYIEDELTVAQDSSQNEYVLKGIPTMDLGEHDLKVNGKIYLADEDGENPVEVGQGGDTLPINSIVEYSGQSVPDGYEEVTKKMYEEDVLYDKYDGTNSNVSLSSSSANYDYLEIYFRSNDGDKFVAYQKVHNPDQKRTGLVYWHLTANTQSYIKVKEVYINGSTIEVLYYTEVSMSGSVSSSASNNIWITRVVGLKEV